jgi:hypothetical protein
VCGSKHIEQRGIRHSAELGRPLTSGAHLPIV